MKKALLSLAVAAAFYCAAVYAAGWFGERSWRAQVAQLQEQAQAGTRIDIVEYRRGLFSSDIHIAATLLPVAPQLSPTRLSVQGHVLHGPLLFGSHHPQVGLFAATGTVHIETGQAELDRQLATQFGDGIGELSARAYFNDDYRLRWHVPSFALDAAGSRISSAETMLSIAGNRREHISTSQLSARHVEIATASGPILSLGPLTLVVAARNIEPGLDIADLTLTIAQLDFAVPPQAAAHFEKLSVQQIQSEAGADIDTSARLSIARATGRMPFTDAYYRVDISGVSREAMKCIVALFGMLPANPAESEAFIAHQYKQGIALLPRNAMLHIEAGAQYAGVAPRAQLQLQYQPPTDGRSIDAVLDSGDALLLADGALLLHAPVPLIPDALVSPYIDHYVAREGDNYVLRISLQQGSVMVGNTVLPKETVATLYAGFASGNTAAPAPRPPPARPPMTAAQRRQKQLRTL